MKKNMLIFGIMLLMGILIVSCGGGDDGPTGSTNNPPTAPTLDGPSGAPTNGATDVSLTPVLRWIATDPDGDALTYTVNFGKTTPAPTFQEVSGTSYSPAGLEYSTKYYWSIIAKDPDGETASSAEWNFTTLAAPIEIINAPTAPSGPSTGIEAQSLNFDASGSVSNLGHTVEYSFEDGLGNNSPWSTTAASFQWSTAGTYDVVVRARCIDHPLVISEWSVAKTVTITAFALETITAPGTISGLGAGEVGVSINFACAAAISSQDHTVYYRWDFGDGAPTSWSSTNSRSHTWATIGDYEVKAQARCNDHQTVISEWSATKTVTISGAAAEIVTPPNAPTFTDSTTIGGATVFTVSGSTTSYGHPVQYQVDFGDGTVTWFAYNATIYRVYDSIGTYVVKAMARCNTHNDITSDWSEEVSVVIVNPPEALSYNTLLVYGDVVEGNIGESYEYTVAHSSATNLGDPMEGQFDWGDGTTSDWSSTQTQSHAWTTEGTYNVTYIGRCSVHNDFTFQTAVLEVTIVTEATETVSKPTYNPNYTVFPPLNEPTGYHALGGTSSLAHPVESRIDWGDGTAMTDWIEGYVDILKTWTEEGVFPFRRQTRCIEHPDIISEWSDPINISPGPETINAPVAPPGPATANKGTAVYFSGAGAVSKWHTSWIAYRIAWGDGDTTDWGTRFDREFGHNYSTVGDHEVTSQAKCVWPTGHTNPISEWSLPSVINILESITFKEGVRGPFNGPINKSLTFEQYKVATSSEGHDMEYRFAFGDGDTSLWAPELTASHTYTTADRFPVKTQARCATHTVAMTAWTTAYYQWFYINITDEPESITLPRVSVGLKTTIGDSTYISIERSTSNYGDSLEFQIDFGDGSDLTEWFPSSYDQYTGRWDMVPDHIYHTYTPVGSYGVSGRARCVAHPTVITDWTEITQLTTAVIVESISIPATPTGPATGTIGSNMTFTTTGATSSEGHQLEYLWAYRGPVNFNADHSTALSDTQVFSVAGEYSLYLSVRCVAHPDITPGRSEEFYFTITE